jgi:TPR repeat protein
MRKTLLLFSLATCCLPVSAGTPPTAETQLITNVAERGNTGAQVLLALDYLHGHGGVALDEQRAAFWFEKAAAGGNAYAQTMLGDMYAEGRGVPRNIGQARRWREKAAQQGNARAQLKLGEMYLYGMGNARDDQKAGEWLGKAGDQGDAHAQYLLGRLYREGRGLPQDLQRGQNWLERARVH